MQAGSSPIADDIEALKAALAAERDYLRENGRKELDSYSDYHGHNFAFLVFGYAEEGRFAEMREANAGEDETVGATHEGRTIFSRTNKCSRVGNTHGTISVEGS